MKTKLKLKKEVKEVLAFIICGLIVFMVARLSVGGYMDKAHKCDQIKGHTCSTYEIDKMGK